MAIIEVRPRLSTGDIPDSPVIRSRYDKHDSVSIEMTTPSMTRQECKDECDINLIVARHAETGLWSNSLKPPTLVPKFIDIANAPDAITAHNLFIQAEQAFQQLPASVRKEFNNSPHELIAFVSNDSNYEKALSLGLVNERVVAQPAPSAPPIESVVPPATE